MSGPGEEYTDDDINDVYDAISDAWEDHTSGGLGGVFGLGDVFGGGGTPSGGETVSGPSGGGGGAIGGAAPPAGPSGAPGGGGGGGITVTGSGSAAGRITVTAKIEWAGELLNNGRGGERTVNLVGVDTRPIVAALRKARNLEILAIRGPLRSYKAKSPQAQLHQLGSTRRGAEALREAGFNPSRRTQRRHENGEIKTWSKTNREKISEAYENMRNPGRGVQGARREVVDALTESLKRLPGHATVRFRDIRSMRIE